MTWVQALLEWLRTFWPFVIVMEWERGVRYWRGQVIQGDLPPNWYWCVPFFMHVETVPVTPDILKLWSLNVSTKDSVGLRIRANVRYEIFNAVAAWNNVQDYKDNLGDEARTHLARVVRERDYKDLLADQTTVEREAKNAMNAVVKEWGIKVIRCSITDFIKTKDLSVAQV